MRKPIVLGQIQMHGQTWILLVIGASVSECGPTRLIIRKMLRKIVALPAFFMCSSRDGLSTHYPPMYNMYNLSVYLFEYVESSVEMTSVYGDIKPRGFLLLLLLLLLVVVVVVVVVVLGTMTCWTICFVLSAVEIAVCSLQSYSYSSSSLSKVETHGNITLRFWKTVSVVS